MPAKPRQRDKIAGMGQAPSQASPPPPQKRRKPSESMHGLAQLQLAGSRVVTGVEPNLAKGLEAGRCTAGVRDNLKRQPPNQLSGLSRSIRFALQKVPYTLHGI
jgi:hypothetical protein